jgi:hypothetical protein
VELYLHFPNMSSWRGAQLKHRDNFTFMKQRTLTHITEYFLEGILNISPWTYQFLVCLSLSSLNILIVCYHKEIVAVSFMFHTCQLSGPCYLAGKANTGTTVTLGKIT